MNNNLKGFAYGIATSVTFGLIPLFTLPLMEKGMRFDSILFYRFLFAAIALSGMLLAKKESFRTEMRNLPILFYWVLFIQARQCSCFGAIILWRRESPRLYISPIRYS